MHLLISVAGPAEARAALRGGADVIDAKDPRRGALGPVSLQRLAAIRAAVAGARPLSAALGDAASEEALAGAVAGAVAVGVAVVKVGFAGVTSEARARRLAVAAQQRVRTDGGGTRLVLVAYADWRRAESLAPARVVAVAADAGAAGVLLDTANKDAPLFTIESPATLAAWIAGAHAAGLFAALAGGLSGPEFARARALGADVVGVRGAACVGGRMGRVSRARVAALRASAGAAPPSPPPPPPLPPLPPRVLAGRGVLPERDVELPEIVRRDDEVLHAARERAEEVRVDEPGWLGVRRLDQHDAPRVDLAGEPGGDGVARDLPGMRERVRGPEPAVRGEHR